MFIDSFSTAQNMSFILYLCVIPTNKKGSNFRDVFRTLSNICDHGLFQKECDAIFVRFLRKNAKKGKIFENVGKNVKNLKIFLKRAASCVRLSHTWNN